MHQLPEALKQVVDQLSKLPGLGPKSALRCAMTLLKWPISETKRFGKGIHDLRESLHLCDKCGALTDINPCAICSDDNRNSDILCLVTDWDSMLTMESGGFYNGQYFILGGLLAPLDKVNVESLEISKLEQRLALGEVSELIIALGATVEAEVTASFIFTRVGAKFPNIKVTRLAQGIPLGAEVKFMDKETLKQSLKYRQDL